MKRNSIKRTCHFCLCLILISALPCCKPSSLSPVKYVKWVEDEQNGLRQTQTIGAYHFTLQYKPKTYMVLKNNPEVARDRQKFETLLAKYQDLEYANFHISSSQPQNLLKPDPTDEQASQKRIQYYSFELGKDFIVTKGLDTLSCVFQHFDQTYGVRPDIRLLLAFAGAGSAEGEHKFIYRDPILTQQSIEFSFSLETLHQIPELAF